MNDTANTPDSMRSSREIIGTGVTAILTRSEVAIATIETGVKSELSATGRRSHFFFSPERSISGKDRVAITPVAFWVVERGEWRGKA